MNPEQSRATVIKIGGNIINDESALSEVLSHFADLKGPKVLIHGGGKLATELAERLEIPQTMIEGRRVTDENTLRIAVMVYAGLINKSIVAGLQSKGVNAAGISGADFDLIRAKRRSPEPIDYGFVGDVTEVKKDTLIQLLESGYTPVFAPLTHDGEGQILNTNADTIAHEVAKALSQHFQVTLIYSFEKEGVLLNVNDNSTLLPQITLEEFLNLKASSKIFAGMIPKLENAFKAIQSGVHQVILGKAQSLPSLLNGSKGTRLIYDK